MVKIKWLTFQRRDLQRKPSRERTKKDELDCTLPEGLDADAAHLPIILLQGCVLIHQVGVLVFQSLNRGEKKEEEVSSTRIEDVRLSSRKKTRLDLSSEISRLL